MEDKAAGASQHRGDKHESSTSASDGQSQEEISAPSRAALEPDMREGPPVEHSERNYIGSHRQNKQAQGGRNHDTKERHQDEWQNLKSDEAGTNVESKPQQKAYKGVLWRRRRQHRVRGHAYFRLLATAKRNGENGR